MELYRLQYYDMGLGKVVFECEAPNYAEANKLFKKANDGVDWFLIDGMKRFNVDKDLPPKKLNKYEFYDSKLEQVVFECEAETNTDAHALFKEETGANYFAIKFVYCRDRRYMRQK